MNDLSAEILVVDDDDDIRTAVIDSLQEHGYQVAGARNGSEALEVLRSGVPAPRLILLDMMMPIMNGQQFLAEQVLDKVLATIPVVLTTADAQAVIDAERLTSHCALEKPFQLVALLRIAARFCGPGRAR